jgi:hypothetical protein
MRNVSRRHTCLRTCCLPLTWSSTRCGGAQPFSLRAHDISEPPRARAAGCPRRLVHDLRRSDVRHLLRVGVPRSIAMKMTGHKTDRGIVAQLEGRSPPLRTIGEMKLSDRESAARRRKSSGTIWRRRVGRRRYSQVVNPSPTSGQTSCGLLPRARSGSK